MGEVLQSLGVLECGLTQRTLHDHPLNTTQTQSTHKITYSYFCVLCTVSELEIARPWKVWFKMR